MGAGGSSRKWNQSEQLMLIKEEEAGGGGGGGSERESRDRGIGNLPGVFGSLWTEINGVWVQGGRRLHNSDKKFALTMGADAEA